MCRARHSSPSDLGREIEAAVTESMKEGEPGLEPASPEPAWRLGWEGRIPKVRAAITSVHSTERY